MRRFLLVLALIGSAWPAVVGVMAAGAAGAPVSVVCVMVVIACYGNLPRDEAPGPDGRPGPEGGEAAQIVLWVFAFAGALLSVAFVGAMLVFTTCMLTLRR